MCSCHSPLILNYVILSHSHSLLNNPLTHTLPSSFSLIIKNQIKLIPPPSPVHHHVIFDIQDFPKIILANPSRMRDNHCPHIFILKIVVNLNIIDSFSNPPPCSQYPWIALQFCIKRQKITIYLNRLKSH